MLYLAKGVKRICLQKWHAYILYYYKNSAVSCVGWDFDSIYLVTIPAQNWLLDIRLTRNIREYLSWLNFRKDIIFYTNIILVCMSTSSPVQVLNNWQTHGQRMRLILYIQLLMCAGGGEECSLLWSHEDLLFPPLVVKLICSVIVIEICDVICKCSDGGEVLYMQEWVRWSSSSESMRNVSFWCSLTVSRWRWWKLEGKREKYVKLCANALTEVTFSTWRNGSGGTAVLKSVRERSLFTVTRVEHSSPPHIPLHSIIEFFVDFWLILPMEFPGRYPP